MKKLCLDINYRNLFRRQLIQPINQFVNLPFQSYRVRHRVGLFSRKDLVDEGDDGLLLFGGNVGNWKLF